MTPEELKDWLDVRPEATRAREATWIASRAAARVLPLLLRDHGDDDKVDLTGLQSCRCILISGVSGLYPTPEIRFAADLAASAANGAARAADAALTSAPRAAAAALAAALAAADAALTSDAARAAAATAAHAAADAAAVALTADAAFLEGGDRLTAPPPLWPAALPGDIAEMWETAQTRLTQDHSADWRFWIDWYNAQLEGRPQDPNMLTEIALIPDADWAKGPAHVNAMINDIRLDHAVSATPNAEILEVNPETQLIRSTPVTEIATGFLEDCRDRMAGAAETFGDLQPDGASNNQYLALLPDIELLTRALERYSDRPQRLYDCALQVVRRVSQREARGECPEAEKDVLVADFKFELIGVANDIRQQDPKVQEVVDARAFEKLANADSSEAAVLSEGAKVLVQATEGILPVEMVEDAEVAADPDADPTTRRNALYRFASRAFRIVSTATRTARGTLKGTAALATEVTVVVTTATVLWKIVVPFLLSLF